MPRQRRTFTPKFKLQLVKLYENGKSRADIAREYELTPSALDQLFMADCATFEEAKQAVELGFDCIGTTLCGYTEETKGINLPNFNLIQQLATSFDCPIIAEGGIWTPEDLKHAFECGAHTAVVGTAITRPMDITKRFVKAVKG